MSLDHFVLEDGDASATVHRHEASLDDVRAVREALVLSCADGARKALRGFAEGWNVQASTSGKRTPPRLALHLWPPQAPDLLAVVDPPSGNGPPRVIVSDSHRRTIGGYALSRRILIALAWGWLWPYDSSG